MERLSLERFRNPLPLDQAILVVWPHLTLLAALTLVCFGLSYVVFMRQVIRSVRSGVAVVWLSESSGPKLANNGDRA